MSLDEAWVQGLLRYEKTLAPPEGNTKKIGRAWIDGCLVVYDPDDCPLWLALALGTRDDEGNTNSKMVAGVWDDAPEPSLT